jgi:hypothetical protein
MSVVIWIIVMSGFILQHIKYRYSHSSLIIWIRLSSEDIAAEKEKTRKTVRRLKTDVPELRKIPERKEKLILSQQELQRLTTY